MSEDRRGVFRRNAFTFGAVEAEGNTVGCLVWDVTEVGAMIELDRALSLPPRVRVRLEPEADLRGATVAWQTDHRAGLSFEG
jgi:hypothetical protein